MSVWSEGREKIMAVFLSLSGKVRSSHLAVLGNRLRKQRERFAPTLT